MIAVLLLLLALVHASDACFRCATNRVVIPLSYMPSSLNLLQRNQMLPRYASGGYHRPMRVRPTALPPLQLRTDITDNTDNEGNEGETETGKKAEEAEEAEAEEADTESATSAQVQELMLSSIKWYKSSLSPIMPKACRFLPTCSRYDVLQLAVDTLLLKLVVWHSAEASYISCIMI
jgi:hypothetical protein